MPPPPAKRRKHLVVHDSEDEASSPPNPQRTIDLTVSSTAKPKSRHTSKSDQSRSSISSRLRNRPNSNVAWSVSSSTLWSPPSSPERDQVKAPRNQKSLANGSLHTFFDTTTSTRSEAKPVKREASLPPAVEAEEQEDAIEDDSLDEEAYKLPATQEKAKLVLDRRKPLQEQTQTKALSTSPRKAINVSQKFVTVGKPKASKEDSTQIELAPSKSVDARPWAERYGPKSLDELMVHKKKVADVKGWLESVFLREERKVWLPYS